MSLNKYDIGKSLGQGAFGSVSIVRRKEDKQIFAMKQIELSRLSLKEKNNSLNEIRLLASLSHKNVIGYEEAFFDESSDTLNIVLEYADDGDLASKIKQNNIHNTHFEESQIWNWLLQILQGVKYLHLNKIMHRDLKNANIFLMKNGTIKLGDLNVSKIAQCDMAFTQIGTPYYASPEILQDRLYDYKCDIWSVGCLVYELCSNKVPFKGNNLKQLYDSVLKGVYEPIPSIYSDELANVIQLMLNVNPNQRPNCDELLKNEIIMTKVNCIDLDNPDNVNKAEIIKTIRFPRNINDINQKLPKKEKKSKGKENEMKIYNAFEIKKDIYKPNIIEVKDNPKIGKNIRKVVTSDESKLNNNFLEKAKKEMNLLVEKGICNEHKEVLVNNKSKFMERISEIKSKYIPDTNNKNKLTKECEKEADSNCLNPLKEQEELPESFNKDNNIKYEEREENTKKDKENEELNVSIKKCCTNPENEQYNFHSYFQEYKKKKLLDLEKDQISTERKERNSNESTQNSNTKPIIEQISNATLINKEKEIINNKYIQYSNNIEDNQQFYQLKDAQHKKNDINLLNKYDFVNKYYNKPKDNFFKDLDKYNPSFKHNNQIKQLKYLLYK